MDAEINNVIYMELYSGPKMVHGKYEKTNVAGSIDRDSTVYWLLHVSAGRLLPKHVGASIQNKGVHIVGHFYYM
jgi:hypothetical protein